MLLCVLCFLGRLFWSLFGLVHRRCVEGQQPARERASASATTAVASRGARSPLHRLALLQRLGPVQVLLRWACWVRVCVCVVCACVCGCLRACGAVLGVCVVPHPLTAVPCIACCLLLPPRRPPPQQRSHRLLLLAEVDVLKQLLPAPRHATPPPRRGHAVAMPPRRRFCFLAEGEGCTSCAQLQGSAYTRGVQRSAAHKGAGREVQQCAACSNSSGSMRARSTAAVSRPRRTAVSHLQQDDVGALRGSGTDHLLGLGLSRGRGGASGAYIWV